MKLVQITMVAMILAIFSISANADLQSLRGGYALDKDSQMFDKKRQMKRKGGFDRNYKKQPPLIPHSIEKERITLRGNTCLKCHSKENHKREKAPAIGESHYLTRDGKKLAKPSTRRWFCNQCHIPQVKADPLVQNNF